MNLRAYLRATGTTIREMRRELIVMYGRCPTGSTLQKISKKVNDPTLEVANMIVSWANNKVTHADLVVDEKRKYTTRLTPKHTEAEDARVVDVEEKIEDLVNEFM